jgi:hypothetical protein
MDKILFSITRTKVDQRLPGIFDEDMFSSGGEDDDDFDHLYSYDGPPNFDNRCSIDANSSRDEPRANHFELLASNVIEGRGAF